MLVALIVGRGVVVVVIVGRGGVVVVVVILCFTLLFAL